MPSRPSNYGQDWAARELARAKSRQITLNQPTRNTNVPMRDPRFMEGDYVEIEGRPGTWRVIMYRGVNTSDGEAVFEYELHETSDGTVRYEKERMLKEVSTLEARKKMVKIDFNSVIIDVEKRDQILEAIEQINQYDLIFDDWGFDEIVEKGRGISMLFWGPPGTGKTLMGQAIAQHLNKTLKVISTADIESSSPGESERNIRKHFKDATKNGQTILLFDECDSLIFSRQSVGPILGAQVNELLSQIERFDGITIFTTNRLGTLDEAVNRRLALKLEFPMPDHEQRVAIWERMIPKKAPITKDVDFERLAIVEIAGGHIKNAVLRAARMAAAEKISKSKKKIRMRHFVKAIEQEALAVQDFEDAKGVEDGRRTNVGGHSIESGRKVVREAKTVKDIVKAKGNEI